MNACNRNIFGQTSCVWNRYKTTGQTSNAKIILKVPEKGKLRMGEGKKGEEEGNRKGKGTERRGRGGCVLGPLACR